MARATSAPWPTASGSVFTGGTASAAVVSRAVADGRVRRLAPGLFTADLGADPIELVVRNRWSILAA
jgi:hypothetical protein